MGDPQFEKIGELFERARELSPAEREALLAETCADDSALRAEVRDLLAFHDREDPRLEPDPAVSAGMGVGTRIGPWRVAATLGTGGMGTVFLAERAEETGETEETGAGDDAQATGAGDLPIRAALKRLHPSLSSAPGFRDRFRREARVGQRIVHPNVVRTFGVVEDDCLVMEYVEGQTLGALAREMERVPEELCLHVAREIALGLAAIHEEGIVHRDLKPTNVLLTPDHQVKIMDFGVALPSETVMNLSRTGQFVGTLRYAAPEQLDGSEQEIDGRADLYALGVMLFELGTGSHPVPDGDLRSVLAWHLREVPDRPSRRVPQLSPLFDEIVATLMEKEPADRIGSAAELATLIQEGEESEWWRTRLERRGAGRTIQRLEVGRETALYGREPELDVLREAFSAVEAGEGRVVILEGEAGIGKTRLIDEFLGGLPATAPDVDVLAGSYPPTSSGSGTGALRAAIRARLGGRDLATTLGRMLGRRADLAPAFAALVRGETRPEVAPQLTRDSLQAIYVDLMRALAARRSLVLVVEDLHFAPGEGRELFAGLAYALRDARVLLLGTTRRESSGPWRAQLERLEHVRWMPLARLGPKELARLLVDALGSRALAEGLSLLLAEKSDGNPFFAFEILRCLRESGRLTRRDDGSWTTSETIRYLELPSSVRQLLLDRVAELDDADREILDVACCCGARFDAGLVAEAIGSARIPLLRALGRIERDHRLVRSAGRAFEFDHHQVHAALYEQLSDALREEYHARLGDVLGARAGDAPRGDAALELCEHFVRGAQPEKALPLVDPALDHLEARFLHDRAVELIERLLAVPDLVDERRTIALLLRCASHLDLLGQVDRHGAVLARAQECADRLDDVLERARVKAGFAWLCQRTARFREAEEAYLESMRLCEECGYHRGVSAAIGNLAAIYKALGDLDRSLDHAQRYLARMREEDDRWGIDSGCGNLASLMMQLGRYGEAGRLYEEQLAVSRELHHRRGEALAIEGLATVAAQSGKHDESRANFEAALAIAREVGDRQMEGGLLGSLGMDCMQVGDIEAAREYFRLGRDLCVQTDSRWGIVVADIHLGQCEAKVGEFDRAREHYERGEKGAVEGGMTPLAIYIRRCLGLLATETGDDAQVESWYGGALALLETHPHPVYELDTRLQYGQWLSEKGRVDEARAQLEAGREVAEAHGQTFRWIQAEALLAALPGGDPAAAKAAFEEHGATLRAPERIDLHYHLWLAGAGRKHIHEARRLMEEHASGYDPKHRDSIIESSRLYRAIRDAAAGDEG